MTLTTKQRQVIEEAISAFEREERLMMGCREEALVALRALLDEPQEVVEPVACSKCSFSSCSYGCKYYSSFVAAKHCQCPACREGIIHASDCAVHNEPAYPNGPCNCGSTPAPIKAMIALIRLQHEALVAASIHVQGVNDPLLVREALAAFEQFEKGEKG